MKQCRTPVALLLLCLTLLACGDDPAAPLELSGSYDLTTIDEASLPASFEIENNCTAWFDWGELQLNLGLFDLRLSRTEECPERATAPPVIISMSGRYEQQGETVVFILGGLGRPELRLNASATDQEIRVVLVEELGLPKLVGRELGFRRPQ